MSKFLKIGDVVNVCKDQMVFNKSIFQMKDASCDQGDIVALRQRFEEDGYLYLKGFHSRTAILEAKNEVCESLKKVNAINDQSTSEKFYPNKTERMQLQLNGESLAITDQANKSQSLLFTDEATKNMDALQKVLSAGNLFELLDQFFESEAVTLEKKWLRAVLPKDYTGIHADRVYMGNGSQKLMTVWTPIDDISTRLGGLVVCKGSHCFNGSVENYRHNKNYKSSHGWFSHYPLDVMNEFGGEWHCSNYEAGDIVLFGLDTLHGSTENLTNRFRISCDTRFQPNNEFVDGRYRKQKRITSLSDGLSYGAY